MRVGVLGLQHESNTFLPTSTSFQHFEAGHVLRGAAIEERYRTAHHEIGGFLAGLAEAGIDAAPLFTAWAMPSGVIEADAGRRLLAHALEAFVSAGPLDGLLVAVHGAAVAEHEGDFDGWWLAALREAAGDALPIIGTLDLHANLSPRMVAATTALIGYRSNPHLDQRQRGVEAAALMAGTLAGRVRPTMAAAYPPLCINIERQLTAASPCRELYAAADDQLRSSGALSNTVLLGFPYADVAETGSSVIVVTDGDAALARRLANDAAKRLWDERPAYIGRLTSVAAAVARVAAANDGPIGLLDMGDNVGGGSPGDGTLLLHALTAAGVRKSLAVLYDPASAASCRQAGVGSELELSLGGKTDDRHGAPVRDRATVLSLGDGKFSESEARHGGQSRFDMGETAVVQLAGGPVTLLTTKRMAPFSLAQLTSVGLHPRDFRAVVIKGVHAPVAAYESACRELLRVDTPGVTRADMTQLAYRNRRRPLFPFEKDFEWSPDGNAVAADRQVDRHVNRS